jgi:tetratricopeptide (TPR) repeat protein
LKEYRKAARKAPSMSEPHALLATAAETKRNFNESAHAHLDAHERIAQAAALKALGGGDSSSSSATPPADGADAAAAAFRVHADAALALAKSALASSDQGAASAVIARLTDHSRAFLQYLVFASDGASAAASPSAKSELEAVALAVLGDARATLGALRRAAASAYVRRAEQIKTQLQFMAATKAVEDGDGAANGYESNAQYAEAAAKASELSREAHEALRRCVAAEVVAAPADSPSSGSSISLQPTNETRAKCFDLRAKIYFERGEHERAVGLWRRATEADPADVYALANLGVALREVRSLPLFVFPRSASPNFAVFRFPLTDFVRPYDFILS